MGGGVVKIRTDNNDSIHFGGHGDVAVIGKMNAWWSSFASGTQCHNSSVRMRDFSITPDGGMVGLIFINESCVPDETLVVKVDSNGDEEWRHEFGKNRSLTNGATLVQDSIIHVYPSLNLSGFRTLPYYKYDLQGNILDSTFQSVPFIFIDILDVTNNGDSIVFHASENDVHFIGKSAVKFDFYRELHRFPNYETVRNPVLYDSLLYYGSSRFSSNDSYYGKVNLNNNSVKRVDKLDKIGSYHSVVKLDSFLVFSFITLNYDSLIVMDLDLNSLYSTTSFHGIGSQTKLLDINDSLFIAYTGDSARFYKFNPDSLPEIEDTEDDTGTFVNRISGKDVDLKIYPNPAGNFIHVENYINANYEIRKLTGQIVKRGKINQTRIEINALPAGSYFLRVTPNDSSQPPQTVTFIKN